MEGPSWRQAMRDALAWRVRLDETAVPAEKLEEFARWRRNPVNWRAWEALQNAVEQRAAMIK